MIENYIYCGTGHPQRQCPAYGRMCGDCGKTNYFMAVCKMTQIHWQGKRSLGLASQYKKSSRMRIPVEQSVKK